MTPGGVHRQGRRNLEEREASRPGHVLRDVERLPAAQPDDRRARWQSRDLPIELLAIEVRDEHRPDEPVIELIGEPIPEVGHRDDQVRPVDERLQLGHEPSSIDGLKRVSHRQER